MCLYVDVFVAWFCGFVCSTVGVFVWGVFVSWLRFSGFGLYVDKFGFVVGFDVGLSDGLLVVLGGLVILVGFWQCILVCCVIVVLLCLVWCFLGGYVSRGFGVI